MRPITIIAIIVCCVAIGAILALKPSERRDCVFSEETKACTWTHP